MRPYWLDPSVPILVDHLRDYSFPSGHTMVSFAAAGSIVLFKPTLGVPAFALATLIAFSRLYLFVHFPTDILGGLLVGLACAYMAKKVMDSWDKKKNQQPSL